jgi:hypothetical protein
LRETDVVKKNVFGAASGVAKQTGSAPSSNAYARHQQRARRKAHTMTRSPLMQSLAVSGMLTVALLATVALLKLVG